MNKIFNFMMLACIMMLASCSSDVEELKLNNLTPEDMLGEKIVMGVGMPEDAETRIAINDLDFTWEEGDQLVAVACVDGMVVKSDFKLVSGAGEQMGTFEGREILGATSYKILYKSENLRISDNDGSFKMDYNDAEQKGINDTKHVKNFLLLCNENVTDIRSSFNLEMKNAIMRLDVASIPNDITSVNAITWYANYKSEGQKLMGVLNFNGKINPSNEGNYLYMVFDPEAGVLNAGSEIAFEFIGNKYYAVKATSTDGMKYEKAKRYTIKISEAAVEGEVTIHDWTDTGAESNQLWMRYVEGTKANQLPKEKKFGHNDEITMKLVDSDPSTPEIDPNDLGWYVYETRDVISSISHVVSNQEKNIVTEIWIPSTCTEISQQAFSGCTKLKKVIFSDNITLIDLQAFSGLKSLTEITIPASVKRIKYNAFRGCTSLSKVVFREGSQLETIESKAFEGTKIEELTLPATLKALDNGNFDGENMKKLTVLFSKSAWVPENALTGDFSNCDLYINKDWEPFIKNNTWTTRHNMKKTFKSVHFVNKEGIEILN